MIGYRKYGHNEVDEPAFTQPKMYEAIRSMKTVAQSYADKLIADGSLKDT
jgi:2-oxoglutarate dehydrogenase E1 component